VNSYKKWKIIRKFYNSGKIDKIISLWDCTTKATGDYFTKILNLSAKVNDIEHQYLSLPILLSTCGLKLET
jgi:hypothetical protein